MNIRYHLPLALALSTVLFAGSMELQAQHHYPTPAEIGQRVLSPLPCTGCPAPLGSAYPFRSQHDTGCCPSIPPYAGPGVPFFGRNVRPLLPGCLRMPCLPMMGGCVEEPCAGSYMTPDGSCETIPGPGPLVTLSVRAQILAAKTRALIPTPSLILPCFGNSTCTTQPGCCATGPAGPTHNEGLPEALAPLANDPYPKALPEPTLMPTEPKPIPVEKKPIDTTAPKDDNPFKDDPNQAAPGENDLDLMTRTTPPTWKKVLAANAVRPASHHSRLKITRTASIRPATHTTPVSRPNTQGRSRGVTIRFVEK